MDAVIERELLVRAPVERVWRIITEPAYVARWFGDHVEIDARPGGAAVFGWSEYGEFAARVERVEPPRVFAFRWMRASGVPYAPAGVWTLVEFTLSPADGGTRLRLVESGFTEEAHVKENSGGWEAELADLVAYAEAAG